VDYFAKDFLSAPTQYGSLSMNISPEDNVHLNFGYRVSAVNGDRFYNDARDVAGSLISTYQSPFMNVSWKTGHHMTWKGEYNNYQYGEGGSTSGAQYCSTTVSATAVVSPCATVAFPTGRNEGVSGLTASRSFHANNATLGVHYEF
jgi:hypothetical protein